MKYRCSHCLWRSRYNEQRLRTSAEKFYSTPNVVDLPSAADELRFYCDDSAASKDPQTILPLTRVVPPVDCSLHPAYRAAEQTTLMDAGSKADDCSGVGMTCVCSTPATSTTRHPVGGFADCGRHQRTVLLVREHSVGYDT